MDDDERQFIGDKAESIVRVDWCKRAGLVANKATEDRCGWDLHVEVPSLISEPPRSLDQAPTERIAYIQVKGTRSTAGGSIRLSHWLRAIDRDQPFFFVLIVLGPDDDVAEAYLVHVDERRIEAGLRRIREVHRDSGPDADLGRITLAVTPEAADRLVAPYSSDFIAKLRASMLESQAVYTAWKQTFRNAVGFPENRIRGVMTFKRDADELKREMIAFGLGDVQQLRFDTISVDEVRFGIPLPVLPESADIGHGFATFSDGSEGVPLFLRATRRAGAPTPPHPIRFRSAHTGPIPLPETTVAFRISSGFFDIRTEDGREFTVAVPRMENDERVPLQAFGSAAEILLAVLDGQATLTLHQSAESGALVSMQVAAPTSALEPLRPTLLAASDAVAITREFGLGPISVTPSELGVDYESRRFLRHAVVDRRASRRGTPKLGDGLTFTMNSPTIDGRRVEPHEVHSRVMYLVTTHALRHDDQILIVWVAALGVAGPGRDTDIAVRLEPSIFDHWHGPASQVTDQFVEQRRQKARVQLEAQNPGALEIDPSRPGEPLVEKSAGREHPSITRPDSGYLVAPKQAQPKSS